MCGILGVVSRPGRFSESLIRNALGSLKHRGPDDTGVQHITLDNWDIWFGHKRLSILDLSSLAHQPMNGRSVEGKDGWIVYNGEIYNFNELKKGIKDRWHFKSTSDTEVLLAGLLIEGTGFLESLNGMLALGFLDFSQRKLILARDRLGKKPLYVYISDELLVFSSELKPFISLDIPLSVNQTAITYYKWLGYIPNELSIYNECIKLPAGNFLNFDLNKSSLTQYQKKQYWDPLIGYANHFNGSYDEAIEEFLYLLDDATKIRLISDVPVGVFLSGGIDSSLIASAVQKTSPGCATAFTVKFMQSDFDESPVAIKTAQQLNLEIEVLHLDSEDLSRQIKIIPHHYDEPFSDSSQIPTLAISEAARKKVTVVLTGDGGDEVFLGYPRYSFLLKLNRIRKILNRIPLANNIIMSLLRSDLGKSSFTSLLRLYGGNIRKVESSINRIHTTLKADSLYQVYDAIMSIHQLSTLSSTDRTRTRKSLYSVVKDWYPKYSWQALENRTLKEHFSAIDIITFMRDDVLVKVDRATMAYSLEARSPLLDYRIVEFGTSLPEQYKSSKGISKMILRDALAKRLKGKLTKLQKSGFDVPLPNDLPVGPDPQAQWNNFILKQWEKSYIEA